jgi:hypothetical protein
MPPSGDMRIIKDRDYLTKLASAGWRNLCYWVREIRRLWVPLLAMAIIGYWRRQLLEDDAFSETARILYKVNIVSGGVILAHMLRSQIFYYISLGDLLKRKDPLWFLGAAILIGLFMFAVIYGFTLGL